MAREADVFFVAFHLKRQGDFFDGPASQPSQGAGIYPLRISRSPDLGRPLLIAGFSMAVALFKLLPVFPLAGGRLALLVF
jgi:hypothetical protein